MIFIILPLIFGYKVGYYSNVDYDYEAITAIGQIVGILISAYLTYRIINQTNTIANVQLRMEKISADYQMVLQKRQLKIELFDRRMTIFEDVLKIFTHVGILNTTLVNEIEIHKKINELVKIHKGIKSLEDKYLNMYTLYRSEFLFSGELLQAIRTIIKQYSELDARINVLDMFQEDKEPKWNAELYNLITENCKTILSFQPYIDEKSKAELNIAEFER
jgi:hypothetical protein